MIRSKNEVLMYKAVSVNDLEAHLHLKTHSFISYNGLKPLQEIGANSAL